MEEFRGQCTSHRGRLARGQGHPARYHPLGTRFTEMRGHECSLSLEHRPSSC